MKNKKLKTTAATTWNYLFYGVAIIAGLAGVVLNLIITIS